MNMICKCTQCRSVFKTSDFRDARIWSDEEFDLLDINPDELIRECDVNNRTISVTPICPICETKDHLVYVEDASELESVRKTPIDRDSLFSIVSANDFDGLNLDQEFIDKFDAYYVIDRSYSSLGVGLYRVAIDSFEKFADILRYINNNKSISSSRHKDFSFDAIVNIEFKSITIYDDYIE